MQVITTGIEIIGEIKYARIVREEKFLLDIADISNKHDVFVLVDRIFHEENLSDLDKYISELARIPVKGIFFSDLAVLKIAYKYHIVDRLIYSPNTLLTNYQDIDFYANEGIFGVVISPFISLEDLQLIGKNKSTRLFFLGYGHLPIMDSRRKLLSCYFEHSEQEFTNYNPFTKFLKEELRDEFYPIVETKNGTAVFSAKPFSIISLIKELSFLDYLIVDDTFEQVAVEFKKALNEDKDLPGTDTGFLNKKMIYRVKEN